jgi:hypothetical protein
MSPSGVTTSIAQTKNVHRANALARRARQFGKADNGIAL